VVRRRQARRVPLPASNSDTVSSLGANGIVGVGTFPQDCGEGCATTGPSNPDLYYECPSPGSGCTVMAESLAQQVQNPVALFATDNNGVIIELPAVTAPEATLSGSLVFGIGTQSNNGLNGATVYPMAPTGPNTGDFTTTFNGAVYDQSFIDSGSNGFFFPTRQYPFVPAATFIARLRPRIFRPSTPDTPERQRARSISAWPTPTICSTIIRPLVYSANWRGRVP
jgi:hypothetical protein